MPWVAGWRLVSMVVCAGSVSGMDEIAFVKTTLSRARESMCGVATPE